MKSLPTDRDTYAVSVKASLIAKIGLGVQIALCAFLASAAPAIATELEEIRDRGHIIIGVKDNRAPLSFLTEEDTLAGFEIDIAERLAEELLGDRTALRLIPVSNTNRINSVITGETDIAIAALTITSARRRIVNFSDPYYLDGAAFITRKPNIRTLRDLAAARIAILDGSSNVPRVRYILPGAELIGVSSYAQGQTLIATNQVDAFAGDASILTSWQPPDQTEYRILPSIISAEPLAIAIPKGIQHNTLQTEINRLLRQWYAEGWLQSRAAHWGLPSETAQFLELSPAAPTDAEP